MCCREREKERERNWLICSLISAMIRTEFPKVLENISRIAYTEKNRKNMFRSFILNITYVCSIMICLNTGNKCLDLYLHICNMCLVSTAQTEYILDYKQYVFI